MVHRIRNFLFSVSLLWAVPFFFILNACGDGAGFSTEEILGESGGEIFYSDPLTDESEGSGDADDDGTRSFDSDDFESGSSGDVTFNDGATVGGGETSYTAPTDDPVDIPVNIAKCEAGDDDDEGDEEDDSGSVYRMMRKAAKRRPPAGLVGKGGITLKGSAGTFSNQDGALSLAVLNLSTGKSVTAEIAEDGSFDAVSIEMESVADAILVGAFDGDALVKSFVFTPRFADDEDEPETCAVPDEEESWEIAKEFAVFPSRR
ncbi:MAG: hypothetical protein HYU99_07915 [Deltaproteobacteria bacterium]|nr:hypothetical protein [Deltaproteobacteria bacterium]